MQPRKNGSEDRTAAYVPSAEEVTRHMPLVHKTVGRFLKKLPPNVLRDDLVAAGTIGLIDSLRKNKGDVGPAFEWYARIRIRGAIVDELRTQDWLTRRARFHASASAESARAAVVGFDDIPGGIGMLPHESEEPTALDRMETELDKADLARAIDRLPERERMIIRSHYLEGVQFKSIAQKLGVSEPRVSQLHARALGLLKTRIEQARERAA